MPCDSLPYRWAEILFRPKPAIASYRGLSGFVSVTVIYMAAIRS
jgi:hypothetical protein